MSDWNGNNLQGYALPLFDNCWKTSVSQRNCFGTSEDRISSWVQVQTSIQSSQTQRDTANWDFPSLLLLPTLVENAASPLSWSCNSHRASQWNRKWVWGIVRDFNPPKHYSSRSKTDTDGDQFLQAKLNPLDFCPSLIWQCLPWMLPCFVLSWDFMGPHPVILDSHYCVAAPVLPPTLQVPWTKRHFPFYKAWQSRAPPPDCTDKGKEQLGNHNGKFEVFFFFDRRRRRRWKIRRNRDGERKAKVFLPMPK